MCIRDRFDIDWSIAEFYIKPEYRKQGFGLSTAKILFENFPGFWEIRSSIKNAGAISFWKKVIHQQKINLLSESKTTDELIFNFKV